MKTARAEKGQATVEMAIGMVVFLTILMFGIYFAEVGHAGMKVTEAAASAMWDATGGQKGMHTWPFNKGPMGTTASFAANNATNRYGDWDGRTSTGSASKSLTQVFSKSDFGTVQCRMNTNGSPGWPSLANQINVGRGGFVDNGGMVCWVDGSKVSLINMPKVMKFFGGFQANNVERVAAIPICAAGRASGGQCTGRFRIAIDDWGLGKHDLASLGDMPVHRTSGLDFGPGFQPIPTNPSYVAMTYMLDKLTNPANGSAQNLLRFVAPGSEALDPEGMFWMSAMTGDSLFLDTSIPAYGATHVWFTTPGGLFPTDLGGRDFPWVTSWGIRLAKGGCFMGRGGC